MFVCPFLPFRSYLPLPNLPKLLFIERQLGIGQQGGGGLAGVGRASRGGVQHRWGRASRNGGGPAGGGHERGRTGRGELDGCIMHRVHTSCYCNQQGGQFIYVMAKVMLSLC